MYKTLSAVLLFCTFSLALAQSVIIGQVVHHGTKTPVSGAIIRQDGDENHTITDPAGYFRLTVQPGSDTLMVSHVGYRTSLLPLSTYVNQSTIALEEYALELKTVTITSRSLNLRDIENGMRLVRDNLYANEMETSNGLYNLFLSALEESDAMDVLARCDYDLSSYQGEQKEFYKRYSEPLKGQRNKKDTSEVDYTRFPAVNISHEGAVLFCEWLTQQYNSSPAKKKFKKVKFRLPTLSEWQIAALGYPKFQSWKLDENFVEVVIPSDTLAGVMKGNKTKVPVGNNNVLYPWFNAYNYRKKPYNHNNCYLGNFRIDGTKPVCNNAIRPGGDGWTKMSPSGAYFPNDMGLYDVVGNVAEMIDEDSKACGGSWNDDPSRSTIHSVKSFRRPNNSVGFRIFMEVVEK